LSKAYNNSCKTCEINEFIAPRFLQCCQGFEWTAPILREFKSWTGDNAMLLRNNHLASKVEEWTPQFPVLSIVAEENMEELKSALGKVNAKVPLNVLVMDATSKANGDWPQLVDKATEFSGGRYPITLVSKWGARGLDFRCFSSRVNRNGGIMLVSTAVCAEREWIQWIGRTARQDNPGQYAVYLANDPELDGSCLQKEREACARAKCGECGPGAARPCCARKLRALVAAKEKLTPQHLDHKVDTLNVASFLQMQCEFYYGRNPLGNQSLPRAGTRDLEFSEYLEKNNGESTIPSPFQ
jgi:hypothetical protein